MTHNNDLHYFSNDRIRMAYDPNTMQFYRLTDTTDNHFTSSPAPSTASCATQNVSTTTPTLGRLVLIVTTHCNLRCRYCYAEGGGYGMELQHMQPALAHKALNWVLQLFSGIDTIQFFGGEPALNCAVIEAICDDLQQRHTTEQLERLPQYTMVTNGTLLPPKLERIFEHYPFHITFSIDGTTEVHNANRIFTDGTGSWRCTMEHFQQLRRQGNVSLGVEMTFTPQALIAGYGVWEIAQFSRTELGLPEPHIVPVQGATDENLHWNGLADVAIASYRAAARTALQSLLEGDYTSFSIVIGILRTLILRQGRKVICPAGITTLAVDPSGDVYPCFMFAGQAQFNLGNVNHAPDIPGFSHKLEAFVHHNLKQSHANCRTCWARELCTGCIGGNWLDAGNLDGESPLMCGIMQAVAEETMLFLGEAQSDPTRWQQFVKQYRALRLDQVTIARDAI